MQGCDVRSSSYWSIRQYHTLRVTLVETSKLVTRRLVVGRRWSLSFMSVGRTERVHISKPSHRTMSASAQLFSSLVEKLSHTGLRLTATRRRRRAGSMTGEEQPCNQLVHDGYETSYSTSICLFARADEGSSHVLTTNLPLFLCKRREAFYHFRN
ncbi:hypothetical protein BJ508DRAFT_28870 [Ascobolus immersus RN42]|uniref:Uncharacterized protein n=1 Tax=Ascobolus immersus RN42 TaxID=1160509 RepID=A0A3N4HM07_ASCIM|nr:hypothetical protein BJ508DRAFT_28870 [Ascobolus immersus RN42]